MDEAKLAEIEARATAIHAEMTHTRTRCDDCGAVNPRLDDRGLHDGCPAGDWPRPPMRDWTKLEGTEGLCEIAGHMTDLVAEVRRLTAALDAARREGAEGMQQRCEETCASIASAHAERFVLKTAGGAIYAAREYGAAKCGAECVDAIRALPLDAPGGAPDCTGVTAQWCPRCGDCACPLLHEGNVEGGRTLNDPKCPLHAPSSPHGDAPGGAS